MHAHSLSSPKETRFFNDPAMSSSKGSHDGDDYVLVDRSDIPDDYQETNYGKRRSIYSVGRRVQFYMDWVCSKYPSILQFLEDVGSELGFPYSAVTAFPKFVQQVYRLLKLPGAEARQIIIASFKKLGVAALVYAVVCLVRMEFTVLGALGYLFTNALMKSALMTSSSPIQDESELEKRVQPIINQAQQEKQTPEVVVPGFTDEQIWRFFERYSQLKAEKEKAEALNQTTLLGAKVDWAYFGAPVDETLTESHSAWTFWFDGHWAKSIKLAVKEEVPVSSVSRFSTFASSEEFKSVYNFIHPPSELAPESELYCFRSFIMSKWDEPNGGKWTLTFPKGNSDNSWKHTLQALIKEQFDHGDDVCGAAVTVTDSQEEIALWTKNAANEAVQLSIGKRWKAILDSNETIGFIIHEDARQLGRRAKNKYEV